jgi:hypothetical protein
VQSPLKATRASTKVDVAVRVLPSTQSFATPYHPLRARTGCCANFPLPIPQPLTPPPTRHLPLLFVDWCGGARQASDAYAAANVGTDSQYIAPERLEFHPASCVAGSCP